MKKNIERDENNLIKGIKYPFDEEGKIIWRELIPDHYLVPNKDRTQETDVSKLEDKEILVLLAGFKELADIHGFTKVSYKFPNSTPEFVSCICRIDFIPSYHTEMRGICFESSADASYNNTQSINGKYFLTTTAENRAFVRCVRNFLRIPILGKDELSGGGKNIIAEDNFEASNASDPKNVLNKKIKDLGINSIENLKERLEKIGDTSYSGYNSFKEIPKDRYFSLIGILAKLNN